MRSCESVRVGHILHFGSMWRLLQYINFHKISWLCHKKHVFS